MLCANAGRALTAPAPSSSVRISGRSGPGGERSSTSRRSLPAEHDRREPAVQMRRVLAAVYAVPGVGWAVATLAVLLFHRVRGELPMTPFGWRLLGGPYERVGTDRLTPLGWALALLLIAVSGADVVIGRWLWQGRRRGAVLALAMAPVSFVLGRLFVLPYLLMMAPLRAVAALFTWRELRR